MLFQAVDHRAEFSKWWVSEYKQVKFPAQGTVFDYFINTSNKEFVLWTEKIPKFEMDSDVPLQVKKFQVNISCEANYEDRN